MTIETANQATVTLMDFLSARIAEDEDLAKHAAFGWGAEWTSETDHAEEWSTVHADGKRDMVGCEDGDVTEHIARHDPARALADCAAKRTIVERWRFLFWNGDSGNLEWVAKALALPYVAHPDYDEAWR